MIRLALALLQAALPPQVTWTVRPDSVTVAQSFTITVAVRAPEATPVGFPLGIDSSETVEAVDPPFVTAAPPENGEVMHTATYRLIAWETGPQAVPFGPVIVGASAATQHFTITPGVFVRSVLPDDSAKRVPRPALAVVGGGLLIWPFALAALALIGLALWIWRARKKRRARPKPMSPLAIAEAALARVDALGLLDAGEPSRYVALHADVLRDYLSARGIPVDKLASLLGEADQVQFARRGVTVERAQEFGADVRKLIAAVDEPFRTAEQERLRKMQQSAPPAPPKRAA